MRFQYDKILAKLTNKVKKILYYLFLLILINSIFFFFWLYFNFGRMNINLLVINFQILLSEFSVFSILRQYNEIYLVKTFVLFVLIIPFSITLCFFLLKRI